MKSISIFDKNDKLVSVTFLEESAKSGDLKVTPVVTADQTSVELEVLPEALANKDFIEKHQDAALDKLKQMKR